MIKSGHSFLKTLITKYIVTIINLLFGLSVFIFLMLQCLSVRLNIVFYINVPSSSFNYFLIIKPTLSVFYIGFASILHCISYLAFLTSHFADTHQYSTHIVLWFFRASNILLILQTENFNCGLKVLRNLSGSDLNQLLFIRYFHRRKFFLKKLQWRFFVALPTLRATFGLPSLFISLLLPLHGWYSSINSISWPTQGRTSSPCEW